METGKLTIKVVLVMASMLLVGCTHTWFPAHEPVVNQDAGITILKVDF